MSEDIPFRLTRKARIVIYIILAVGCLIALLLVFSPASLKQRETFTNFLLGVDSLAIGIMLFVIYGRFPAWRKFVESMTLLLLFMAPAGLIIPLLLSYGVTIYFFLPAYLACLFGWLFFSKHVIYGENHWHVDPTKLQTLVPWFILIGLFFIGTIILAVLAPHITNQVNLD